MLKPTIQLEPASLAQFSIKEDRPTLLKGAAATWAALNKWTPEYLLENFSDRVVSLSQYQTNPHQRSRDKTKVTLGEYLEVITDLRPETPFVNHESYVAGWHFLKNAHELLDDIEIPEIFKDNVLNRVDSEVINYDSMSLFVGHSRVETPLHTDSFAVCVWLANLVGKKVIRVIAPVDYDNIHNGLDAFDPTVVDRLGYLGIDVLEATIEAGDIFVIPPGYWHQVRNDGFTVAVSVNYISPYHFLTYEQQLKAKVLAPYLRLLKIKRELVGAKDLQHSIDVLRHFKFVENESRFLDYMEREFHEERKILERATQLVNHDPLGN